MRHVQFELRLRERGVRAGVRRRRRRVLLAVPRRLPDPLSSRRGAAIPPVLLH